MCMFMVLQAQLRGPDQQPGILGRLRRTARFGSQQPFTPERLLVSSHLPLHPPSLPPAWVPAAAGVDHLQRPVVSQTPQPAFCSA
jgi:hypothetical protein